MKDEIEMIRVMLQDDVNTTLSEGKDAFTYIPLPFQIEELDYQGLVALGIISRANDFDLLATMANLANLTAWMPILAAAPSMKGLETPVFGQYDTNLDVVGFSKRMRGVRGVELYNVVLRAQWWLTTISKLILGNVNSQQGSLVYGNEEEE